MLDGTPYFERRSSFVSVCCASCAGCLQIGKNLASTTSLGKLSRMRSATHRPSRLINSTDHAFGWQKAVYDAWSSLITYHIDGEEIRTCKGHLRPRARTRFSQSFRASVVVGIPSKNQPRIVDAQIGKPFTLTPDNCFPEVGGCRLVPQKIAVLTTRTSFHSRRRTIANR